MRLRLATWQEAMPAIMRQAESEFRPLVQAYAVQQKAMVLLLDQMHQYKSMGKKDRAKLVDLICSIALDVLADGDDAELKEIYNRHSGGDFDVEAGQEGAALRDMMEQMLGVQLDAEVDLRSPEAVLEALAAQMRQRAGHAQQTMHPWAGFFPHRLFRFGFRHDRRVGTAAVRIDVRCRGLRLF
jgi:hypothetical protein